MLPDAFIGELEGTLLQSYIKAAKLRRWLGRPDCPPALTECKALFDKAYTPHDEYMPGREDTLGTSSKAVSVPADLHVLVKQAKVVLHARLVLGRIVYARSTTHLGNSLIYFYVDGNKTRPPTPGCIKYIFEIDHRISFAVHRQLSLHDDSLDPFRHYPHFAARLYSTDLSTRLEVMQVDWVMCHFARWLLSPEHAVVLSLSLVSFLSASVLKMLM
jgi:hypothetical protein